jgi:hypothetical protein
MKKSCLPYHRGFRLCRQGETSDKNLFAGRLRQKTLKREGGLAAGAERKQLISCALPLNENSEVL